MSKKFPNEIIQPDLEVINSIAGVLLEDEKSQLLLSAEVLAGQAEGRFESAGRFFKTSSEYLDRAEKDLPKELALLQAEQAQIVSRMRRTEESWLEATINPNPSSTDTPERIRELAAVKGTYKAAFVPELRKQIRIKLMGIEKYAGWVTRGKELETRIEAIPGEIESLRTRAARFKSDGDLCATKGRELMAEAKKLEDEFNASK